ncbi:MAG TPA: HD domain-containing protein [Nitrospirae bacterium]|nr:HD domain-containing protein [Nitrospirota bacterium]
MSVVDKISEYLPFLGKEFIRPVNYATAFAIGAIINIGMGYGISHHLLPYIVPVIIQAFSKASINFKHRDMDMLLGLPAERMDPAFVMDKNGHIATSLGQTYDFFKSNNISAFHHLFGEQDTKEVLELCGRHDQKSSANIFELYSQLANKWYQVKIKFDRKTGYILVWLENITQQKDFEHRLSITRMFSSELITSIKEISKANDIYDKLANLFLQEGYEGVFIARENESGDFTGHVLKIKNGGLSKSDPIEIEHNSMAPVLASRKSKRVVSETRDKFETQKAFDKAHPFHAKVREFLGFEIKNFINYHEGEVSIIAFNKANEIGRYDLTVMETTVNTARSATYLIDMSISNEERFLQIITGLAAASEYSDELTGKHILRVNEYASLLARSLGCDDEFSETIGQVAALHDIGKVAIPEIIKLKRKLTDSEIKKMQMHPVYGAKIVEQMTSQATHTDFRLMMARNISLNHHQQWNGKGYPGLVNNRGGMVGLDSENPEYYSKFRPLKEGEIPMEALIVSLADKYDALRSARQYKPAFSHEKTTDILTKDDRTGASGEDVFGPEIFALYIDIQGKFEEIFTGMQDS